LKPQIKNNLPFSEYINYPAMSKSKLFRLDKGPAEFLAPPGKSTPAMEFGRLAHLRFLEPVRFAKEVVQEVKFDRRTKVGKADYAEWMELNRNMQIVKKSDMDTLYNMALALDNYTIAKNLLNHGDSEVSCFFEWRDILWKTRFDKLNTNTSLNIIVDYKTTKDIYKFDNDIFNFGYDVQSALYRKAAGSYFGVPFNFLLVAQQKTTPYAVAVKNMTISEGGKPSPNEIGETRLDNLIGKYKLYESAGWKLLDGRYIDDTIKVVKVPQWALYL